MIVARDRQITGFADAGVPFARSEAYGTAFRSYVGVDARTPIEGNYVIASYGGPAIESRVAVYRSDAGIFALQVYNNEQGLQVFAGPESLKVRTLCSPSLSIAEKLAQASEAGLRSRSQQPGRLNCCGFGWVRNGDVLNGASVVSLPTLCRFRTAYFKQYPEDQ